MIKGFCKNINISYIILYILPLSLIFYATLSTFYGKTNALFSLLLSTRALSIFVCSCIGWFITRHYHGGQLSKSAFIFSFYCLFSVVFVEMSSNVLVAAVTILFWPFTLWIGEKAQFSTHTFCITAYIVSLFCNLMSFMTIQGRSNLDLLSAMDSSTAVGAANSIYLVLSMLPFIFLIPNKVVRIVSLILPLLAFLMANKSTCIIASLISLVYFYYEDIKHSRNIFIFLFLFLVVAFFIYSYALPSIDVNMNTIFESLSDDFSSGGNGRTDIIENVVQKFIENDIIYQIFGSGFFAVARDTQLSAHNDILEILYDYGIFGLLFFFSFLYHLYLKRKMLPKGSPNYHVFTVSVFIYLTCCAGSNFIVQQINMLFFALLWGTIDKY